MRGRRPLLFILRSILAFLCAAGITGNASAFAGNEALTRSMSHYMTGLLLDWYGQNDEAIAEYEKAVTFDPASYIIRLRLGANYVREAEYPKAISQLNKAAELKPQDLQPHYLLALVYSSTQNFKKAAEEYELILKSLSATDPQNVEVFSYLGQLYYSQGEYQKAVEQFKRILVIEPNNAEVMSILGSLYLETEERPEAIEMFQKALEIDPEHDGSLNSLGYMYAEDGIHLDKAIELISRALRIDPDNGAYLDSLGWAYFKKGQYEKALGNLQKAVILFEDPVIYDHLGDVYLKLDQQDKALESWRNSLEMKPDQEHVVQKIKLLQ